jgi:hypothetical protein
VGTSNILTRTINITYRSADEYKDVVQNGLNVMVKPCGDLGTIASVLATVNLFYNKNASNIAIANKNFLTYRKVYDSFVPRNSSKVGFDLEGLIKSGDNLQVVKLDGLDPLIAWGTGGRTGHTAIAVWDGGELYVCESTDASPFGSYWPPPYGIIKTPWAQWVEQAHNATFSVVVLPLSEEASNAFSADKFWKWFATVEGLPYGYHVMLYSFLDTYAPAQNLPLPLTDTTIDFFLPYLDRLVGNDNVTNGANFYSLIGEGLNRRLGINCTGNGMMNCLSAYLVEKNMSYAEATAIPELDTWTYDGGNYSMMCSAFVANAYKVSMGAFLPPINSHEFTPKDVYQMAIFEPASTGQRFNLSSCPDGLITSAQGSYCQVIGDFCVAVERVQHH